MNYWTQINADLQDFISHKDSKHVLSEAEGHVLSEAEEKNISLTLVALCLVHRIRMEWQKLSAVICVNLRSINI